VTAEIGGTVSVIDVPWAQGGGDPDHRGRGFQTQRGGGTQMARKSWWRWASHNVAVIDAQSHEVITTIPVGRSAWGLPNSRRQKGLCANGVSNDCLGDRYRDPEVIASIPWGRCLGASPFRARGRSHA